MEKLSKAYWMGEPVTNLAAPFHDAFAESFELMDCRGDISVLSDKGHRYFFYYLTDDPPEEAKGVVTLCENLDKRLIVIHPEGSQPRFFPDAICAEHYALNMLTLPAWLSQIKLKYFLHSQLEGEQVSLEKAFSRSGKCSFSDVVLYISSNVHKDIREEDAASLCHYSPSYFSKVFHRKVGMCFRDYVTAKRIALAKKMLLEDESMKIAYIAYQCGYRDVSYFSRIFKKKTGLSPANYRRQF
ncbi:helix-turn-helix domain-containing protein [Vibrio diabolicus]|uniref:helix-turn-helix domain-containing protein n=1 Tax=Vibrio diabolicus TaxID=50719 RepID=UPI001B821FAC|nr:AraC family transcriptional regulator [Vibrio diabolicus]HBC3895547.1 helix-turn-helix transcriptional regulator [Vibrio parahaemolyticus]HDU8586872.1 helix-turn-helix transcriptional regulator [Vibrio alginolyticus]